MSCVLTLAYLSTRDTYRIEGEEKSRKGYADKKVLAVAICYDSKEKEHKCKIEEI